MMKPMAWMTWMLMLLPNAGHAVEVKVVAPGRGDVVRYVTLPGSIRANQEAVLHAKVAGYLKSLGVDKGDRVKAGQPLGEIEVPELSAQLAKNQAEFRTARIEYQRVNSALQKAPDLVTPQEVEEAQGRMDIAQAELGRTETLLAYSKIAAPFDGVVTMRYVDPGAFIPAATTSGGKDTAIVQLMDFSTVRAQVPVPEMEAPQVTPGQPVRVTVESLPGRVFEGTVTRLAYALDDATRTMLVESDLPNGELLLRPGMFATIQLGVEKRTGVMTLPLDAVLMEKSGASVFVAEGGVARKRGVKTGISDGIQVEIQEGLTGGEQVIQFGKTPPADGAAVQVAGGS